VAQKLLRPLAFFIVILVWLFVMSLPVLAFLIATRGEIQLGTDAKNSLRLFLVHEDDVQGLGLEWSKPHGRSGECTKTTVRYLLWEGSEPGQGVEYCRCFDAASGLPGESRPCAEF
jgi:hypothetical protein